MTPTQLRDFAKTGARLRLAELAQEIKATTAILAQLEGRKKPMAKAAVPKKTHWTQTPAGKRKLAASMKRSWKARKAAGNEI